jgi:hypothetical protein
MTTVIASPRLPLHSSRSFFIALALFALGILALSLYQGCEREGPDGPPAYTSRVDTVRDQVDTVYRERWDTVQVPIVKVRTVTRERTLVAYVDSSSGSLDTLLVCNPFAAPFDTTSDNVRLRGTIAFRESGNPPLRIEDLRVTRLDTSATITRTVEVERIVREGAPFLERLAEDGAFFLAGYGVRYLVEPRSGSAGGIPSQAKRGGLLETRGVSPRARGAELPIVALPNGTRIGITVGIGVDF